jgi:hypothetical protein
MKTYGSGGIAPCIPNLGARWRWVVRFTPQPLYLPVPTEYEAGWTPKPVWPTLTCTTLCSYEYYIQTVTLDLTLILPLLANKYAAISKFEIWSVTGFAIPVWTRDLPSTSTNRANYWGLNIHWLHVINWMARLPTYNKCNATLLCRG